MSGQAELIARWNSEVQGWIDGMKAQGWTAAQIRKELWKSYMSQVGDAHGFVQTEQRLAQQFPDDADTARPERSGETGVAAMVLRQAQRIGLRN